MLLVEVRHRRAAAGLNRCDSVTLSPDAPRRSRVRGAQALASHVSLVLENLALVQQSDHALAMLARAQAKNASAKLTTSPKKEASTLPGQKWQERCSSILAKTSAAAAFRSLAASGDAEG